MSKKSSDLQPRSLPKALVKANRTVTVSRQSGPIGWEYQVQLLKGSEIQYEVTFVDCRQQKNTLNEIITDWIKHAKA